MRRRVTWVIVGVLAVVVAVAAVDAMRSPESPGLRGTEKATTGEAVSSEPLPRCAAQQIAVSIEAPGGSATIVVRHAWGKSCHLARLPIDLTVRDRAGRRVRLLAADEPSGVAGDFSPGFERLINITYRPGHYCNRPGPFVASVNVGPYFARRTLSASEIDCFRGG
jgi:hypothetical protein